MINLVSVADKVTLVTSAAADIDVHASFVDATTVVGVIVAATFKPDNKNTAIASATTTDIVSAPSANVARNVKTLSIRNKHATTSNVVTVRVVNGTATVEQFKITLLAGEHLQYEEGTGWRAFDAAGGEKQAGRTGRFLRSNTLTSGTSFVTGPDTNSIVVRMVGGGGGGGGCTSVAAAAAAAGGGGAGGFAEKVFAVTPNTAYTYQVGAAGNGASGGAGGNATDSTFAVGAVTVTAKGGTGAPVATAATTLTARAGGPGGVVSTNGDINGSGDPGANGVVLIVAGPILASGAGGSGPFGAGGLGLVAAANGNNGVGFGAGGGGSATGASAVRTGGNGTQGVVVVDEYA